MWHGEMVAPGPAEQQSLTDKDVYPSIEKAVQHKWNLEWSNVPLRNKLQHIGPLQEIGLEWLRLSLAD